MSDDLYLFTFSIAFGHDVRLYRIDTYRTTLKEACERILGNIYYNVNSVDFISGIREENEINGLASVDVAYRDERTIKFQLKKIEIEDYL